MNNWFSFLSPLLLLSTAVHAWGTRFSETPSEPRSLPEDHFPRNEEQGWFLEESYLLMKPFLGGLEIGDVVSPEGTAVDLEFDIKVKEPKFKWNSGVRLGIGRYLPNQDKWDLSFYSTFLYGSSDNRFHNKSDTAKGLFPAYTAAPMAFVLSHKTKAFWRLNYFVWDLMLGRQFSMTPKIILHPYLGLRGTLILDEFKSRNVGIVQQVPAVTPFSGIEKIKLQEHFWGLGPRLGTHWDYQFVGHWSFLGNLAASLLYGHYHVKERLSIPVSINHTISPFTLKSFDHSDTLRINLDCSLGLGWERWFNDNTVRIAPTFQFEGSLWVDMNDFSSRPLSNFTQNPGDLGLIGFSFNLLVDF